jgi:Cu(I)/Ag(I) efflux system protein CusF
MSAAALAVLLGGASTAPASAHPGHAEHAQVPQTAEAMGVIKSVDAKGGTVTIAHEPISALGWPAMTMKFKVASGSVLSGVAVGGKVHFVLQNQGGKPVVTQIHKI